MPPSSPTVVPPLAGTLAALPGSQTDRPAATKSSAAVLAEPVARGAESDRPRHDEDDDDDVDEESEDESDAGSLVDFVVDEKAEGGASKAKDDDRIAREEDPLALCASNILPAGSKRANRGKPPERWAEVVYRTNRALLLEDVPPEERAAALGEEDEDDDDDEDGDSDDEDDSDGEYVEGEESDDEEDEEDDDDDDDEEEEDDDDEDAELDDVVRGAQQPPCKKPKVEAAPAQASVEVA